MKLNWHFLATYDEATVENHAPLGAGVYLLWVKLKDGRWRCFYAGQSSGLEGRLLEHLSPDEPNGCIKKKVGAYICGFEYAEVGRQSDRDGIEKYLYDCYSPECNKQDPGGAPVVVNLPE